MNKAAIDLLDKWLADESGYDEETWPKIRKALEAESAAIEHLAALLRAVDAAFEVSENAPLRDKNHDEHWTELDAALAAIGRKPSNMLRSDGDE